MFVLPGPSLDRDAHGVLHPSVYRAVFRRKGDRKSPQWALNFESREDLNLHAREAVSLRIGMVDVTAGPTTAGFSTQPESAGPGTVLLLCCHLCHCSPLAFCCLRLLSCGARRAVL
jgi:hypothetical protein